MKQFKKIKEYLTLFDFGEFNEKQLSTILLVHSLVEPELQRQRISSMLTSARKAAMVGGAKKIKVA